MTTCFLAPDPIQSTQFIPGGNVPCNGGQLFFYQNNTTTKQTVYKDPTGSTAWSNPIVLDSGGNLPSGGEVWFQTGLTYTVVYAPANDADPPVSPYWTKNDLEGINDAGLQNQYILISEKSATGLQSTLTFSTDIAWSSYVEIDFKIYGIVPTNSSATMRMRVSDDGGATFKSTGYGLGLSGFAVMSSTGVGITITSGAAIASGTGIPLTFPGSPTGMSTNNAFYGEVKMMRPSTQEALKFFYIEAGNYIDNTNQIVHAGGLSVCSTVPTGVNAARVEITAGNFSTGTVKCFGIPT